jgi:hypothetical protein
MNCEAGETESDIERIAGGTAEMPNSHTILGVRGVFWRFIQDCSTNTPLTEEFGPKCGAFVALPAALINAVTSFLNVGTGQSI